MIVRCEKCGFNFDVAMTTTVAQNCPKCFPVLPGTRWVTSGGTTEVRKPNKMNKEALIRMVKDFDNDEKMTYSEMAQKIDKLISQAQQDLVKKIRKDINGMVIEKVGNSAKTVDQVLALPSLQVDEEK